MGAVKLFWFFLKPPPFTSFLLFCFYSTFPFQTARTQRRELESALASCSSGALERRKAKNKAVFFRGRGRLAPSQRKRFARLLPHSLSSPALARPFLRPACDARDLSRAFSESVTRTRIKTHSTEIVFSFSLLSCKTFKALEKS